MSEGYEFRYRPRSRIRKWIFLNNKPSWRYDWIFGIGTLLIYKWKTSKGEQE